MVDTLVLETSGCSGRAGSMPVSRTNRIEDVMSLEWNNFKLSEKAQAYADKLIKEADENRKLYGGVISKSNVKLDDDLNVIGVYNESS